MNHKRCPRGYHIELWPDGFYHVYLGGGCIAEELTRKNALKVAYDDKWRRHTADLDEVLKMSMAEDAEE